MQQAACHQNKNNRNWYSYVRVFEYFTSLKYVNSMSNPPTSNSGLITTRILILVLVLSLAGLGIWWFLPQRTGSNLSSVRVPKEIQLTYLPAEYQVNINEDDAVQILTNPKRYRREFDQLIYDLNVSILQHVGRRMGLTAEQQFNVKEEYDQQHPYLRKLYYEDFMEIQDTTSVFARSWYQRESGSAASAMEMVAGKYTCFLVNQILTKVIPTQEGSLYAKGKKVNTPCGVAMAEALQPIIKRMEQSAEVADFSKAKGMLEERVEKAIAELATYEMQSKKGLSKRLQTKIWGVAVSATNVEISAVSVMKVGFKLDKYLNIDLREGSRTVVFTLPEPEILSHAVYPRMDKFDIGWLREVEGNMLNESFELLREEFVKEAMRENVMDKAKDRAEEVMQMLVGPIMSGLGNNYRLLVRYQPPSETKDWDVRDEFTDLPTTARDTSF